MSIVALVSGGLDSTLMAKLTDEAISRTFGYSKSDLNLMPKKHARSFSALHASNRATESPNCCRFFGFKNLELD